MTQMDGLPTFLIVGSMKAGTTSLHKYLNRHPNIFMSRPKELDFFVEELNWSRGIEWYRKHFGGSGAALAVGESSTSYTKLPRYMGVANRIATLLPEARIIYLIREPLARIRSHYIHEVAAGREKRTLEVALSGPSDYVEFTRYAVQIHSYLQHFEDRVLVLTSEWLRDRRREALDLVCSFLNVPDFSSIPLPDRSYNVSSEKQVAGPIESILRQLPGYAMVSRAFPKGLKQRTRRMMSRELDPTSTDVSRSTASQVLDNLRPEIEQIRPLVVHDFDGWGYL